MEWLDYAKFKILNSKKPITFVGHNSKFFYGNPPRKDNEILNTSGYEGVIDYDPSELVVVVRCGTSITKLESLLASKNQTLGFDPPRFLARSSKTNKLSPSGTIGGMVATGLEGPQRIFNGSCREAVLGLSILNSDGELLKFGGTVIKNVAGYDISRLHVGAMGTLGLILDISLRVKPLPMTERTIAIPAKFFQMIQIVNNFFSDYLPISSTSWTNNSVYKFFEKEMLILRLSGPKKSVAKALEHIFRCQKEAYIVEKERADSFWNLLRDQRFSFFTAPLGGGFLWRVSLPFGNDFVSLDKLDQWAEWGNALRWVRTDKDPEWFFSFIKSQGGNATIYRVPEDLITTQDRFTRPEWIEKELQTKIKKKLDPKFIFNPGRLYSFI